MSLSKKRVLLIIPNLDFGGAQNSFARLSEILHPYYELMLVVFNRENMAPLEVKGEFVDLDVYGSDSLMKKIFSFVRRVIRLRKLKKKFRPDFSISFLEGADYINVLSSVGEKIFFYLHGSKYYDRNITGSIGWIRKKLLIPLFYNKADLILVVNDQLRAELIRYFGITRPGFRVMPNFYDHGQLDTLASKPVPERLQRIFTDYPTLCISGRIAPEKGIDRFIKIFNAILEKESRIKLVILGDGAHKKEVIRACSEEGITFSEFDGSRAFDGSVSVVFLGYQKNPYQFLARTTLLILPSLNEGMPNTIVEAMCLGVPVIAADCPYGPRELLSDNKNDNPRKWPEYAEYGVLVPVLHGNVEEKIYWTEAISRIVADATLRDRYVSAGRERSLLFSKEYNIKTWRALLDSNEE